MAVAETHVEQTQAPAAGRQAAKKWALFVGLGVLLYLALYAWSEYLVYSHGEKNRFFMVRTAPAEHYDTVILGASHAMPFGFEDMNRKLEEATGQRIINLSVEGGGILPNRLLLDYFLAEHTADNVVFFLDSFAFYSEKWNEARLDDAALQRAPLDPRLAAVLWRHDWARGLLPAYLSGFAKINNHDRFATDLPEAETEKFGSVYRPFPQIDRRRIRFLYPDGADANALQKYLAEFARLISFVEDRGIRMIVVKPPTPPRYREGLPSEPAFDAAVAAVIREQGLELHDFSGTMTDDRYFYDTDHLNRDGVAAFISSHFAEMLRR